MKADIGIYHGDEAWALRGLGIDFERSFQKIGYSTVRTDQVFRGIRPLNTKYHFFVQQGQLCHFATQNKSVPKNTVCLFTHCNKTFAQELKVLNHAKGVIFFSQLQEGLAISNGLKEGISTSIIMAADPGKHRIIESGSLNTKLLETLGLSSKRNNVGFCLRYWEKSTYQSRKSYDKLVQVINELSSTGIPCIILGPGWEKAKDLSKKAKIIYTEYKNYEHIYNTMKIYASVSINEGGPLPLLESMMCGATPVATSTGFSPELMQKVCPSNILPCMASSTEIVQKIISCYHDQIDEHLVSMHAQKFSFLNAARKISEKYFND